MSVAAVSVMSAIVAPDIRSSCPVPLSTIPTERFEIVAVIPAVTREKSIALSPSASEKRSSP